MSENNSSEGAPGGQGSESGGEGNEPWDEDRAKAAMARKNQENKSLRERVKALEPLAQEAQRLADEKKPEIERLTSQIATLTRERDDRSLDVKRLTVALRHGLDEDDLDMLGNTDDDEKLDAIAKRLAGYKAGGSDDGDGGDGGQQQQTQQRPVEKLKPGGGGASKSDRLNPLEAAVFGAVGGI